jgi:NADH:ubiquinone oxidoreductase subunit 5 (subunit L)/multisubunit Na+/H+ antiporter MnhA subunit
MIYFWGILGIVAWILVAFWPARWAQSKGYNFFLFLILSWFISFVLTLLIVLFLRDKTETPESIADDDAVEEVLEKEQHQ